MACFVCFFLLHLTKKVKQIGQEPATALRLGRALLLLLLLLRLLQECIERPLWLLLGLWLLLLLLDDRWKLLGLLRLLNRSGRGRLCWSGRCSRRVKKERTLHTADVVSQNGISTDICEKLLAVDSERLALRLLSKQLTESQENELIILYKQLVSVPLRQCRYTKYKETRAATLPRRWSCLRRRKRKSLAAGRATG